MTTLGTAVKRSNNNYDLVRLIAALMVVIGHSFELFNAAGRVDPIRAWLKFDYSGSLAVYIFFFLSGIFITASFVNSKSHLHFVLMRIFRIWPALIVCIIITVFIIGPSVSALSLKLYFSSRETWSYLVHDILLYNIRYSLPGVFEANHYKGAVNGSLWTLPLEIKCYVMIFILGLMRVFKRGITVAVVFSLIFIFFLAGNRYFSDFGGSIQIIFFLAGSLVYHFRKYVYIDWRICLSLIIICLLIGYGNAEFLKPFFYITLVYAVLYLGSSKWFRNIKLPGDYSYGIYIYGFVVQQVFTRLLPHISSATSLIITIPAIIFIGILSWHLIEHPSIDYGRKLSQFGR